MKNKTILFFILIILLCVTIGFAHKSIPIQQPIQLSTHEPYRDARQSQFDKLNCKNKVVFLGDSITEMFNVSEFFPEVQVANRGISGDYSDSIVDRLDSIIVDKPPKIFIMMGINDLYKFKDSNRLIENYETVFKKIREQSPDTKIYIQSILPINNDLFTKDISNNDIVRLNKLIKELSTKHNATFIDLYPLFEKNNQLNKEFTCDGVHLKGDAYLILVNKIKEYVIN